MLCVWAWPVVSTQVSRKETLEEQENIYELVEQVEKIAMSLISRKDCNVAAISNSIHWHF